MSKQKIAHLSLLAKPAPAASSNVTPLPVARPELEARVVVELLEDAAAVHLVIDGESFRVATVTEGGPRSRLVAAQAFGEQVLADVLAEDGGAHG